MKVDFMLIGAAKSGTTTVADILKNHPDINFCKRKEPNFFSTSQNWRKEIDNYHNLFEQENNKLLYGEASTSYTVYPHLNLEIWNDIYEYNPRMKFIYIIRNPIHRIISQYMQSFQKGRINGTIEQMIVNSAKEINRSKYHLQISPFINLFGKDQVLIIHFDDLLDNREKLLYEISLFLNIDVKKFKNYDEVYSNVSINGKKLNYKLDSIRKKFTPILKILPDYFKHSVRKIITNPKRVFKEKPKVSRQYQEIIINLTKWDLMEMQKITGRDYSDWLMVDKNKLKI